MKIFMKFIGKSMMERKARLILLLFAIAMSTALFIASMGAVEAGIDSFIKPITAGFEGMEIRIESEENGLIDPSKINKEGILDMRSYIQVQGLHQTDAMENIAFYGMGEDWVQSKNWIEGDKNSGLSEREAMISYRTKEELGLNLGDHVEVMLFGNIETFEISGIADVEGIFYSDLSNSFALAVPRETAQEIFGMGENVNRVTARSSMDTIDAGILAFNESNDGFQAQEIIDLDGVRAQLDQITAIFYGMLIMVVLMSSFIIYGSFKLIITERLPVIGTFFSQGATKGDIRKILYLESGLYGLFGGILGSAIGMGLLYLIQYFLSPLREYGITGSFEIQLDLVLAGMVFSILLSLLSCTLPILKTGKMQVKNVILNIEEQKRKSGILGFVVGTVLLAFVTATVYLEPEFMVPSSLVLILLSVLSLTLIYPRVVSFLTPFLFKGMKGMSGASALGLHNVSSSKSLRGNITLLILSILAMVSIHSVSMSLQDIVVDAFQDMDYDYSVSQIRMQDKDSLNALREAIREHPKVIDDSIHEQMLGYGKINETNSLIMGIDPEKFADFNPYLGFRNEENKEFYERFIENSEGKIIVSKNIANLGGIEAGDRLPLEIEGRTRTYEVAGIVDGKLYFNGSFIMIDNRDLRENFHYSYVDDIYFHGTERSETVADEIRDVVGAFGAQVITVDKAMENNLEGNRQMMNILSVFSIMAVVIGAFGALNNIIISFIQRKKDLAILSSIGMTSGQRSRMILMESAVTVLWAILFITPYGYVMARLITAVTSMIGLPIPVEFSPVTMIPFYIAALILFIVATLPAVMKNRTLSIIREIQFE